MFQKGHKFGKGNSNSGRRTLSEEVIERARKKNFEELSKEAVSRHLEAMIADPTSDRDDVEKIALPIVLKGMTTRTDVTSGNRPLIMPSEIMGKNNIATNVIDTVTIKDSPLPEKI